MAKLPLHLKIIFWIFAGCMGSSCMGIRWSKILDNRLMDIFYGTYPDDESHFGRVKREWDRQVPGHNGVGVDELKDHVKELQNRHWNQWKKHPENEREALENYLVFLYNSVKKNPQDQEKHMLDMFLSQFSQYAGAARLMRTIIYRWHKLYTPLGKEIPAANVDWTLQRKAFLQNILNQIDERDQNGARKIKQSWVAEYRHLNVDEESLLRCAHYIRNKNEQRPSVREIRQRMQRNSSQLDSDEDTTEEEGCTSRGGKSKWEPQMEADILCIMDKLRGEKVTLAAAVKDRWDRMQRNHTNSKGESLLVHATRLRKRNHMPELEHFLDAEDRYKELPPLPKEVFTKRGGKKKSQQLRIQEGHQSSQQHYEGPASPSVELTPELLMMLEHGMAGINASYGEHAHYLQQTDYHGSSSHTPSDQGHFTPLPGTLHQHQQFWNPVGSSSHTPTQPDPFGLLPHTSYPHQYFWDVGGSSTHTSAHLNPFDSRPSIQHPYENFISPGGSSSYTPIQEDPSGALLNIPNLHEHFSSPGGSSSYSPIQEDPSGFIVVAPRPQHHLRDPRGSSSRTSTREGPSGSIAETSGQRRLRQPDHHEGRSHTLIHENPSGLMTVGPRPRQLQLDHRGRGNRTSVHEESFQQHADTPRPYPHQFFPGGGSRYRLHPPQ